MSKNERIVVTGLGIVSSAGQSVADFFDNAIKGVVSISDVKGIDISRMRHHRGGEIHHFAIEEHFPDSLELKSAQRATQFALAAAKQCLDNVELNKEIDPFRIGVIIGFTQGESKALEKVTEAIVQQRTQDAIDAMVGYLPQTISQSIATQFGLYGPNFTFGQACSAGNFAIGLALDKLKAGVVDAVLTGGADAFSRYCYAGFSRLGAIAADTPRPFSIERTGMVPAEGSGMLLLETLTSARKRGALIYAEIIGYGESSDAHHITQPKVEGIAQAVNGALSSANIKSEQIDYISVHGTGTRPSDQAESQVLAMIYQNNPPPFSSIKSHCWWNDLFPKSHN